MAVQVALAAQRAEGVEGVAEVEPADPQAEVELGLLEDKVGQPHLEAPAVLVANRRVLPTTLHIVFAENRKAEVVAAATEQTDITCIHAARRHNGGITDMQEEILMPPLRTPSVGACSEEVVREGKDVVACMLYIDHIDWPITAEWVHKVAVEVTTAIGVCSVAKGAKAAAI